MLVHLQGLRVHNATYPGGQNGNPSLLRSEGVLIMKLVLVLFVAGWAASVASQQMPSQADKPAVSIDAPEVVVPSGFIILVTINREVTSATAGAGNEVHLKLVQDVKDSSGGVLVPKNASLRAHVVGARAYTKNLDARLSIVVDRAEWDSHFAILNAIMSAVPRYAGAQHPTPWKGPGGPVGVTIGDPAHGIPARTPTDPGNKPEIPVAHDLRDMEGVEIGYLPDLQVTVLVSKVDNIRLHKGTVIEFRQRHPANSTRP